MTANGTLRPISALQYSSRYWSKSAAREGCSARQVNMTISLAFLAPDLVKAAIEGRLPHGHGVTRMRDLPAEWPRQRRMLGL